MISLVTARGELGLTQAGLAKRSGCNQSMISKLARKLLALLWKLVNTGEIPQDTADVATVIAAWRRATAAAMLAAVVHKVIEVDLRKSGGAWGGAGRELFVEFIAKRSACSIATV